MVSEVGVQRIRVDVRGVVYREGEWHIAHCLELDIAAQGETRDEAVKTAMELCDLQIETALKDGDLRSIFRPAPPELWELYARAKSMRHQPKRPPAVNRLEFRELVPQ